MFLKMTFVLKCQNKNEKESNFAFPSNFFGSLTFLQSFCFIDWRRIIKK